MHIFFHPDYNRWSRSFTGSAACAVRGLYRQWGISPRPEDILFTCFIPIIIRSSGQCKPLGKFFVEHSFRFYLTNPAGTGKMESSHKKEAGPWP